MRVLPGTPISPELAIALFVANSKSDQEDGGLYFGNSGDLLTNLYLYKYTGDEGFNQRTKVLLNKVFETLNSSKVLMTGHGLCYGLAGIGLMLTILFDLEIVDQETVASFEELKPLLWDAVARQMAVNNNDLFYGAFGILYYLSFTEIQTRDNPEIKKSITRVIAMMLRDQRGGRLPNCPPGMSGFKNQVNLSLSHGNSGFLIVLLRLFRLGYCQQEIQLIVSESLKYIVGSRNMKKSDAVCSQYPLSIDEQRDEFFYGNRMGWCYGDTNIVLVLYTAGLLFKNNEYLQLADDMGLAICRRTLEEDTLVSDSHFCHGSSGLAAYYAYLYRLTGRSRYQDAYEFWIEATISLLSRDIGSGLYENKNGLLTGLSGPLLTLLGHRFNDQGALWNRAFTFY